jgi:hypothetical protein
MTDNRSVRYCRLCCWLSFVLIGACGIADEPAKKSPPPLRLSHQELHERLGARIDRVAYSKSPVGHVIKEFAEKHQIPLTVDSKAVNFETPVTVIVENVTVQQTLNVIAACTGTVVDIAYPRSPSWAALTITSPEKQQERQQRWEQNRQSAGDLAEGIAETLRQITDFHFTGTPLQDALDFLGNYHNMDVKYQGPPELAQSAVTVEQEKITLREGLDLMLKPLKFGYYEEAGALIVTTKKAADAVRVSRAYALPLHLGLDEAEAAIKAEWNQSGFEGHVVLGALLVYGNEGQHSAIEQLLVKLRNAPARAIVTAAAVRRRAPLYLPAAQIQPSSPSKSP